MVIESEKLKDLKEWAQRYKKVLETFEIDLELKINYKSNIYIAIDYFDIIVHLYPMDGLSRKNNERELKKEIARIGLFKTLGSIYNHPLVLLPPYISECNDFFAIAKHRLFDMEDNKDKNAFYKDIENVYDKLINIRYGGADSFIDQSDQSIINIALLYSPYFMKGLNGLKELLRTDVSAIPNGFDNYLNMVNDIREIGNKNHFKVINRLRPGKALSNIRDAKAIQYIEEINKITNNKIILLLATSSSVFISYNISHGLNKQISGYAYPLLRLMEFFYYVIIYMYTSLGLYKTGVDFKKFDLDEAQMKQLQSFLEYHLNILRYILSLTDDYVDAVETGGLCGRFNKESMEESINKSIRLKNITESIEKDLNMAYLKDLSGNENLDYLRGFINEKYISYLNIIRGEIKEKQFSDLLINKITELEKEQIYFENSLGTALGSIIQGSCENLKSDHLVCINESEFTKILAKNFNMVNKLLEEKELNILKNPEIIELSENEWLIYDDGHINNIFYLLRPNPERSYDICKMDMKILYRKLTDDYMKYRRGELFLSLLKKSPLINLLEKILPFGENLQIENLEEIRNKLREINMTN